jgi:hypothetical protein
LFSFTQKCSWAQEPCKECAGRGKSRGYEPKGSIEGLLLQVCAESKEIQHLEVSERLSQGVRARVFSKAQSHKKAQEG